MKPEEKYQGNVLPKREAVIAELLRVSQQNLKAALHLALPPNRLALSFCEKAAGHLTRAVLFSEGEFVELGQNLQCMIEKIPHVNPLASKLRDIQDLSSFVLNAQHSTSTGEIPPPPNAGVFLSYLNKVGNTLNETAERFGVDLSPNANTPAQTPEPIR